MELWKAVIVAGNQAYASHRLERAESCYLSACKRSLQLLPLWVDHEEGMVALIVSHQNLADLYFMESRPQAALSTYRQLVDVLLDYKAHNDDEAVQQTISFGIRRLRTELEHTFSVRKIDSSDARDLLALTARELPKGSLQ